MTHTGLRAGFDLGRQRALGKRALGVGLLMVVIAVVFAWVEARTESYGSTHRVLTGSIFGVLIPLAIVASSRRVLSQMRLDETAELYARFGVSRRSVALGLMLAAIVTGAVLAAAIGVASIAVSHDPTAPARAVDALTTGWIGLLTGAAYAALFALGTTFGAKGRYGALLLDLLLGGAGSVAIVTPRAHALNLLGGAPPLMLSQSASAAALVGLTAALTALALARLEP
jgi:hypothetical protein